jgi:hypothetical protein
LYWGRRRRLRRGHSRSGESEDDGNREDGRNLEDLRHVGQRAIDNHGRFCPCELWSHGRGAHYFSSEIGAFVDVWCRDWQSPVVLERQLTDEYFEGTVIRRRDCVGFSQRPRGLGCELVERAIALLFGQRNQDGWRPFFVHRYSPYA